MATTIQRYDLKKGAHSDKEIATLEEQLEQALQKINEVQSEYNQFSGDDERKERFGVVVEKLRVLQIKIEQKINEISSSNDFKKYERTYESAKQEDRSRDQKKASEKEKEARKKLMLEIDQIVEKIKKLCEDKSANSATVTKARSDMDAKKEEIFSMADETLAKQTDLVFTAQIKSFIDESLDNDMVVETLNKKFEKIKINWFNIKDLVNNLLKRSAQKSILNNLDFEKYEQLKNSFQIVSDEAEADVKLKVQEQNLTDQYGKIIEEACKIQGEADELRHQEKNVDKGLPKELKDKFYKDICKAAGFRDGFANWEGAPENIRKLHEEWQRLSYLR